jgi:hypothetical protein
MKLHEFGLWFRCWRGWNEYLWSSTIPRDGDFDIFYNGYLLATQAANFELIVDWRYLNKIPYKMIVPNLIKKEGTASAYEVGRLLTMEDFNIVPNPLYTGDL